MDVHVDQTREDGRAAKVDDLRARDVGEPRPDFRDLAAADDDAGVADRRLAGLGDQRSGVDHGRAFRRGSLSGRRRGEAERDSGDHDHSFNEASLFFSSEVYSGRHR